MSEGKTPYVLGELIEDRAKRNGDRIFLYFKDPSYSYNDMDRNANRCANAFLKQGIKKGDKVSIMLPNCPEYMFIWFGSARVGAVEVPINTSYKGEFLRHIIDQSDSKMLFIDREWLDRLKLIQDDLKKLEKVVVLGGLTKEDSAGIKFPMISWEEFFDAPETPVDIKIYPIDPSEHHLSRPERRVFPRAPWVRTRFGLW